MKTLAILIQGGTVAGIYEVENAPHDRIIVVDDDIIRDATHRNLDAKAQLTGYEPDGTVDFKEVHTELSNYINSEDL